MNAITSPLAGFDKRLFVGARYSVPLLIIALLLSSACAVVQTPPSLKIALFAPFEGRYREVGYSALYAARLALADTGLAQVDLLPVDDGGTQAASHAAALAADPQVLAAVVLGYDATAPETLAAFGDIPVLVVGDWGAQPSSDSIFVLSNPEIEAQSSIPPRTSVTDAAALPVTVVGGDVLALEGFAELRDELDGVTVLSSGALPDGDFSERYRDSDPFAPEPGLLATLSYDTTGIAALAAQYGQRDTALDAISALEYGGLNGAIHFENGYWAEAPIHRYHYVDGLLTEDTVE